MSSIRPIRLPNTQKGYKNAIYYDAAANFRGNALLQVKQWKIICLSAFGFAVWFRYHAVRPGRGKPALPVKQGLRK